MRTLIEYVQGHAVRGECQCGRCIDRGNSPDPSGHVANMVFFKVGLQGIPTAEDFRRVTAENREGSFAACNPLDGVGHDYTEIGAWIGSQELALLYMGLGVILGVFDLLSPHTMLGLPEDDPRAMQCASMGALAITEKRNA